MIYSRIDRIRDISDDGTLWLVHARLVTYVVEAVDRYRKKTGSRYNVHGFLYRTSLLVVTIFDSCSQLDNLSLEFGCDRLLDHFGGTAALNYEPITYICETGDDCDHLTLTPLCRWTIQRLLILTPPAIGSFPVTWLSLPSR